jgi:hypothetical protein
MASDADRPEPAPPQRVTLPDCLIRAITLVAANPQAPPIAAVEAAVLITFGYALYQRQESISPWQVAIPTAQWTTICQALLDVPGTSEVGRVNLGLDWVNLGPAGYDGPADPAADAPIHHDPDVESADHPVAPWQAAVAAGATRFGYPQWVAVQQTTTASGMGWRR